MSLNYNFIETFKLLLQSFKYNIMIAVSLSSIMFTIILIINKNNKKINYIIGFINIILLLFVAYYHLKNIFSFKFSNPINNIYFYFFNTVIYLIISSIMNFKTKYKVINFVIYGLSLINIIFSIFMTYYLGNNTLLLIGNIFPMIKFGNILYIIYYLFTTVEVLKHKCKTI